MWIETIVSIASGSESLSDKFPKTTTVGKLASEVLDLAGRPSRKLYQDDELLRGGRGEGGVVGAESR